MLSSQLEQLDSGEDKEDIGRVLEGKKTNVNVGQLGNNSVALACEMETQFHEMLQASQN